MAKRGSATKTTASRIMVLGANGQLGLALFGLYGRKGEAERLIPKSHAALDITDHSQVFAAVKAAAPDVIVNAAALTTPTAVRNNPRVAWAVNSLAAGNLAKICAVLQITYIQLSTADVFGGDFRVEPYREFDSLSPASLLGQTKAAAEHAVLSVRLSGNEDEALRSFRWYVLRLSELFSDGAAYYPSFVSVLSSRLFGARAPVRVPDAVRRCLSYAPLVAEHVAWLADNSQDVEPGIYHVTSSDSCNLFELAATLARTENRAAPVECCSRDTYAAICGLPATEVPYNTTLATTRWQSVCPLPLLTWRDTVRLFLQQR